MKPVFASSNMPIISLTDIPGAKKLFKTRAEDKYYFPADTHPVIGTTPAKDTLVHRM